MYSDKEKQRVTTLARVRRYRERQKGVTEMPQDVTPVARSVTPSPKNVTPKPSIGVTPCSEAYEKALAGQKQAKLAELRALIAKPRQSKPLVQSHDDIPIYNPSVHKAGDRVRVWWNGKFVVKTIPHLDAEGQPIP